MKRSETESKNPVGEPAPPPATTVPSDDSDGEDQGLSAWKRFRHRIEELTCQFFAATIPRLSQANYVRVAHALGALAFTLDGRGRRVALSNLECAFGDRFSPAEREEIARRSYQNFVRTELGLFWARRLTPETFSDSIRVEGFDPVRERIERDGHGAIGLCVHQGNWEWASLAGGFLGFAGVVVAENFKNPRLSAIFTGLRQMSGNTVIPQESAMIRLLKVVKRRGHAGMLIDLSFRPSQAMTAVSAFDGLLMCVPLLHAVLAQRAGAMLVPVETQPLPDGSCRVIAHPPLDPPAGASLHEIAQLCWDAFEPIIRDRPHEYLWPYKHFRYRPKNAARPYPFYANTSGAFEKLLRREGAT